VPELPEVEVLRQELAKDVLGRKVKTVAVTNGKVVRRNKTAKDFRALLEGRIFKTAARLGDQLVVGLDNGSSLVVHPGPTGQLRRAKSAREAKEKFTHVVIAFTQGGELRYADHRALGELFVSEPLPEGQHAEISASSQVAMGGEGAALRASVPELACLGFDPIEDVMSWERFAVVLRRCTLGLKSFLTDQSLVAGLSDLYSDEILFAAGLRPDRDTDSLSTIEVRRLWRSMVEILAEAIKHGGSSLEVEPFVDLYGKPGNFQQFHEVYAREGEPCRRCRRPVMKVKSQNRMTFFCEHCQI
jgi:formamidopyrimidine-DNA glycosylase